MNNDLILKSLKWIIENTETRRTIDDDAYNEKDRLLIDIDMVLNPEVEPTISEKTKDAFSEETEVKE